MKKHLKLLTVLGILSLTIIGCHSNSASSQSSSGGESSTSSSQTSEQSSNPNSSSSNSSSSASSSSSSIAPKKYTVTWQNYDGAVLELDEGVLEGTMPSYDGETPFKEQDVQYNYVFAGWTPEVEAVSRDTTYVATFTEEIRSYTVVWKDEDGTVLETDNEVPYGSMPEFNAEEPTKESTVSKTYTFAGWSPEVEAVTGSATYVAQYKEDVRKYTITWKNEDGTVLKTEEVAYGETPEYVGDEPTKASTSQYQYTFNGWSPVITEVNEDAEYVATFTEEIRTYKVTWVNYDGTVLEEDVLDYGQSPVYNGENPVRPNDHGLEYTWKGWSPTIVPVYQDTVYTAKYTYKAFFDFTRMHYELEDGYQESDLQGAPWVNTNIKGQLDMIKKPSLKDDFYAAINYDDIKNGVPGPFEVDSYYVNWALNAIYYNTLETTNGDYLYAVYNKLFTGDIENVSNYLNNLDVETYLSSKELFASRGSYFKLASFSDDAYEVVFNDGYVGGEVGLNVLWFYSNYYTQFDTYAKNITNRLASVYNLSISSSELSSAKSLDTKLSSSIYEGANSTGTSAYNTYSVNMLPWAPMKSALLDLGVDGDTNIVIRKYAVNAINTLFNSYVSNSSQLPTVKNDIALRLAFDYRFLTGPENYEYLNKQMSYAGMYSAEQDLYKYAQYGNEYFIRQVLRVISPEVFEQSYIELSGDVETKQRVANLIEDVLEGYNAVMSEITWLSDTTKTNILRKLNKMSYQSCYSDRYLNFSEIDKTDIDSASLLDLYTRYSCALVKDALDHVPEDPFEWVWSVMPSYTVNAFYTVQYNSFVILNGVVPGFLSESVEEFYGMLGFVIGHEITHAFDSSGSQYDENGNYSSLMTATDRSNFNRRVNKLISFYNKISLFDGQKVDGDNVDGEATADMGGIRVMLKLAESIPDFDYDKFFRAAARTWCTQPYSQGEVDARLSDAHPFAYLRVNVTLAQFDKFYETYDIGPGDGMYIPEDQRISVW